MTPDFDPTLVDWNHPDVEYVMKHAKTAIANRDGEIVTLKKSKEQLQDKYDKLLAAYSLLEGGGKGAVSNTVRHKEVEEDPSKKRSYNVREYKGYPKPDAPDRGKAAEPREVNICRTDVADDIYCRGCGCMLSGITSRYHKVTEDIHDGILAGTNWTIIRRYCKNCNVQQTSIPRGVLPGEHYGIDIMAQVAVMRCMTVSFDKIREMLDMFYKGSIPRSTLNHICDVAARNLEPLYEKMKADLPQYDCIGGDGTGWFLNKEHWQTLVFVGQKNRRPDTVVFEIAKSGGKKAIMEVLGDGYSGIVLSDSDSSWNHVGKMHQKCLLHYFRDMYKTLKNNTSSEFSLFFMRLYCALKDAIGTNRHTPEEARTLQARVMRLISAEYQDPDCRRYVKRLKREAGHLFTFLVRDVDYHNNTSERALRRIAEYRKILYGSRSKDGAHRTKILMSAYATCKARDVNFYEFLKDCLSGRVDRIPAAPAGLARCAVAA